MISSAQYCTSSVKMGDKPVAAAAISVPVVLFDGVALGAGIDSVSSRSGRLRDPISGAAAAFVFGLLALATDTALQAAASVIYRAAIQRDPDSVFTCSHWAFSFCSSTENTSPRLASPTMS